MKRWLPIVGYAAVLFGTGMFSMAFAASLSTPVTLINPLGSSCSDLSCPVSAVANFLFTIAIPLCGIMILVGGFQMMTSAGDPEKFSTGKKTLLYAVVGFIVVLLSGSVAKLIQSAFGGS